MQKPATIRQSAAWCGVAAALCAGLGWAVSPGQAEADAWQEAFHLPPLSVAILASLGLSAAVAAFGRPATSTLISKLLAAIGVLLALAGLTEILPLAPAAALGFALSGLGLLVKGRDRYGAFTASAGLALASSAIVLITASADMLPLSGIGTIGFEHLTPLADVGLLAVNIALLLMQPSYDWLGSFGEAGVVSLWSRRVLLAIFVAPFGLGLLQRILSKADMADTNLVLAACSIVYTTMVVMMVVKMAEAVHVQDRRIREVGATSDRLMAGLQYQASSLQREMAQRTKDLEAAEQSLRSAAEANARLAVVARHTHNGVILTDGTGQIIWANPAWEHLSGQLQSDLTGRDIRNLMGDDADPESAGQFRAQIQSGRAGEIEVRFQSQQGQDLRLAVTIRPVHDMAGSLTNFIVVTNDVTAYRESEERVRAANDRLQFALRSSGYGVFELNLDTNLLHWDDRMYEVYGIRAGEFDGAVKTWMSLIHPDDLPVVDIHRRRVLSGELNRYDVEFRIRRKDGELRYIEAHAFMVHDTLGRPKGMVGINRDITAEHKMRENLRVAEERLELALFATSEGVWDWNLSTGQIYRDRRWSEIVGRVDHKTIGSFQDWSDRVFPDDLPAARAALDAHLAGKTPLFMQEYRMRTDAGRWIWTLDRGRVVSRDPDGKPTRMVGTQCDVTDRKTLEQRLRNSEEISIHVSRLAAIGAWEWTLSQEFMTWSPELFRLTGVELGFEPTLVTMANLFPVEERETFTQAIDRATKDGKPFDLEASLISSRGKRVWVRVIGQAEFKDGRAVRIFGALQDVTGRHEAEESQRTLEAQLFQVQKMETLGTLAGGIAHDFNNLLTGIMGYQDLALDTLEEENPARGCLSEARNASIRARELVDQILTFSRQTGVGERMPIDMAQVIEEARRFLRSTVPSNIHIDVQISPHCGRVSADATQIHQLLLNLGTNAAHAMRGGGGTLSISLKPEELEVPRAFPHGNIPAGHYVKLGVADTGHGIDPETLKRVFDPFFTTKGVGEGTGLGLAVVHGIARAHGGAIAVESTLGQGTTFEIYLPSVAEQVEELPMVQEPIPLGQGEMICVVDDEDFVAQVTRASLQRFGYRCVVFNDPLVCLDALRRDPSGCSLLLSDQTMPGMAGMKLAATVREFAPKLPILVMSGYFSEISPQALDQIGRIALLSKPFTAQELSRAVDRLLHPN